MYLQRHRSQSSSPASEVQGSSHRTTPAGIPRFLTAAASSQTVNEVARTGTRGVGERLPHRERLQSAFGHAHDLSTIDAHTGGEAAAACASLGADAYAAGTSLAFRSRPSLWLAAHEAAHAVQQRHGRVPAGGLDTPGDRYEREASAVADRVVAGRSAAELLPRGDERRGDGAGHARGDATSPARDAGAHSSGASASGVVVQRYTNETIGGAAAQVGAGRQTALFDSQTLYAASSLIGGANTKLQAAGKKGSYIELKEAGGSVSVDGNTLKGVQPEFLKKASSAHAGVEKANAPGGMDSERTAHGPMALWTDCGRSSAAVTGSAGYGDRSIVYYENGVAKLGKGMTDKTVSKWLRGEPNQMANEVYMKLLPAFIERPDNTAFLVEGVHFDVGTHAAGGAAAGATAGTTFGAILGGIAGGGLGAAVGGALGGALGGMAGAELGSKLEHRVYRKPATILEAKSMYLLLGNAGMDKFDKEAHINFYANPEVGESYSMATEGDMPDFKTYPGESTWNYHWAGVVVKDGTDNITLENYAVTDKYAKSKGVAQYDFIDRGWIFAMYGTTVAAQSFHERHLASKTHGTRATSIAARTDQ
jgi:hypothetical protein